MMSFLMAPILEPEAQPLVRRLLRPQAVRSTMRSRFVHPADCVTGPQRSYVWKHILAPGDVGALIGQPGSGKSILAPFIAYAVAQGRPLFGLRTKPGKVLYICAEDMGGMRQRVHSLKLLYGDAPDLAIVDCGSLLAKAELNDLQATVVDWKPALVIIDTLGAAWAGLDENSAQEMGEVVRTARAIAATGAACLIVHHIAKQGDGSPRGHSVLNGTLDMSLRLEAKNEAGIIRGTMLKNRNGSTDRDIAFRFEAVSLGYDDDGEAITAPRAIEVDASQARASKAPKLAPRDARGLAVLQQLSIGHVGVTEDDWRAACEEQRVCDSANPANRVKGLSAVLRTLSEKGHVITVNGMLQMIGATPATAT